MHWMRRAASRADCTAGRSKAISTAMMAITTRSSIKVNAERRVFMGSFSSRITGMKIEYDKSRSVNARPLMAARIRTTKRSRKRAKLAPGVHER